MSRILTSEDDSVAVRASRQDPELAEWVENRRKFIEENALDVVNLDI